MTVASEIHAFARNEILSTLAERYESRTFSRELWQKMADTGLFGLFVPETYGGLGGRPQGLIDAVDAFVTGGCDLGLCLSWLDHLLIHTHVLHRFGSEEQKRRYLPGLVDGRSIGALAVSEPDIGADPARMKSAALRSDGHYTLSGDKVFITNGPVADVVIVLARTGPGEGKEGISALLVETTTPGFRIRQKMDFGFLHTSPHGELAFEDCRVPESNLVGLVGKGHVGISRAVFGWERYVLLCALGAHFRALLDRLVDALRARGAPQADLSRRIAAAHVTLEGLREAIAGWAGEALQRDRLDGRLMQRLLFTGQAFHRLWTDIRDILTQVDPPDDPVFAILVNDARLLEINARLFALQMGRTARTLFGG